MKNIWLFFKKLFKRAKEPKIIMTTEKLRELWGDEPLPYENSDMNDRYLRWLYLLDYWEC